MNKILPYRIHAERVIIIPDVHQEIDWVEAILREEADGWDHLVFLGDYFDSFKHPPDIASAAETARFLKVLQKRYTGRSTYLLGNHDLPYFEFLRHSQSGPLPAFPLNNCSGFSLIRFREIAKVLDAECLSKFRLFVECNGRLLSHAGVHPNYWLRGHPGIEDPLEALNAHCQIALEYFDRRRMSILGCGQARLGPEGVGGITWLDWDHEFEDSPHLPPQIVGHTPSKLGMRSKGSSYCIDGDQSCWALLDDNGNLQIRYLPGFR